MSVAPMLPPASAPSTVRGPRGAVVIPFPAACPPAEPAELAELEPAQSEPAHPGAAQPAEPAERPATWPVRLPRRMARPRRVVRPARPPRPGSVSPGSVSPGSVSPGSVSPGSVSPGALRLTRRGRVVLAVGVLLAAVIFGVLASRLVHTGTTIPPAAPAVVEVQPGDTVWSIARRVAPQADTRAVVDAIIARNGLVGGAVHPGQRLVIRP